MLQALRSRFSPPQAWAGAVESAEDFREMARVIVPNGGRNVGDREIRTAQKIVRPAKAQLLDKAVWRFAGRNLERSREVEPAEARHVGQPVYRDRLVEMLIDVAPDPQEIGGRYSSPDLRQISLRGTLPKYEPAGKGLAQGIELDHAHRLLGHVEAIQHGARQMVDHLVVADARREPGAGLLPQSGQKAPCNIVQEPARDENGEHVKAIRYDRLDLFSARHATYGPGSYWRIVQYVAARREHVMGTSLEMHADHVRVRRHRLTVVHPSATRRRQMARGNDAAVGILENALGPRRYEFTDSEGYHRPPFQTLLD